MLSKGQNAHDNNKALSIKVPLHQYPIMQV